MIIMYQSLEFVTETRILTELKIENRGKIYFPWGSEGDGEVWGGGGGGGAGYRACHRTPLEISVLFSLAIPGSVYALICEHYSGVGKNYYVWVSVCNSGISSLSRRRITLPFEC